MWVQWFLDSVEGCLHRLCSAGWLEEYEFAVRNGDSVTPSKRLSSGFYTTLQDRPLGYYQIWSWGHCSILLSVILQHGRGLSTKWRGLKGWQGQRLRVHVQITGSRLLTQCLIGVMLTQRISLYKCYMFLTYIIIYCHYTMFPIP
jgi:hypothetical protein